MRPRISTEDTRGSFENDRRSEKDFGLLALDSRKVNCEPHGNGHINATYLVKTESGKRYVLQRINDRTFPDVDGLMENIVRVTEYLRERSDDLRTVLPLVPTKSGKFWAQNETGCWRIYDYVECGLRFLTDYLDGDHYFSVRRDGQNLDRTRTQMKLVLDMESKWQELNKIVAEEVVVNAGSVHI